MEKKEICRNITRALKEGKWLDIKYYNINKNKTTQFWIAITNINAIDRKFEVYMFNHLKAMDTKMPVISFDRILYASVIEFTSYERPMELIKRIEMNREIYNWFYNDNCYNNILNYYLECSIMDNEPYQQEYIYVKGIDMNQFRKTLHFQLNDNQAITIIDKLYEEYENVYNKYLTLVINRMSIDISNNKKYVVCYYELSFDPKKKCLILDPTLRFNSSFMIEGRTYSLFTYISMDIDEFMKTFEAKEEEYKEMIVKNLGNENYINTNPDIMILEREILVDLESSFIEIQDRYYNNNINPPLKSFFGTVVEEQKLICENKNNEPILVFRDSKLNLNQLRVMYNSFKHHVTYVHGPPGTGKTKTILNVMLSALINGKTVLVCSSNNKPIDSIKKQLNFKYNGNEFSFPFLRLGNNKEVENTLNGITEIYKKDNRYLKIEIDRVIKSMAKEMNHMEINDSHGDTNYSSLDILADLKRKILEYQKNLIQNIIQHEKRLRIIKYVKNYMGFLKLFVKNNNKNSLKVWFIDKIEEIGQLLKPPFENTKVNEQRKIIFNIINKIEYLLLKKISPLIIKNNNLIKEIVRKGKKIKKEFRELGIISEITNKEKLKELLEVLNSHQQSLMEKYFYYRHLQTIENLISPRYRDLQIICRIENKENKIREFNKYCSEKRNMEKLLEVFPIILSTNISSQKLGPPNMMFDLVIMDEAGQCNISTALIPITKAKNLLVVGDPYQLRPIIKIN
ncbi:hypothetical protein PIROE2DRAFT_60667 [Piromyces sp. E2]|nr:hypothetical protein PIROE2DRAFT_60667 [Piromyces sp. E2]|eukprot:OUM64463.1 hypothetical protein PIROE2DRAFT_60667 [Piromyces sp. E2]